MNGWKVTAIICIILLILETAFIFWAGKVGNEISQNEKKCAYNICIAQGYNSYTYDSVMQLCSCYDNGRLKITEKMD